MNKFIQATINRIEPKGLIDLFVAIMPGLIIAAFVQQPFALLIPFYSICAVIPFRQHQKTWLFFLHVHLIFLLSALFVFIIKIHLINCLILLAFSLFFGYLDTHLKELKVLSAWFFIGVLYGDAEMRNDLAALTPHTLLLIYAAILASCIFFRLFFRKRLPAKLVWQDRYFDLSYFVDYSRYFIFFIISTAVWLNFHISQPQWLFWSGLSVLNFDLVAARKKLKQRLSAGSIGVLIGLGYIMFFSSNRYTLSLSYIGILLSLRAFRNYSDGFGVRCCCTTIFAGSSYLVVGQTRLTDILIGGVIGIVIASILSQCARYSKQGCR